MSLAENIRPVHELQIRALKDMVDFQKAEQVQQETWGFTDRDITPASIFSVACNFGGQAIGAFDGERMLAFALSFGALETGNVHLHSHMVAVLPEYQNLGLGRRMKLAQREDALSRSIDQIMWTFDPLQLRNAYFNISRLGGNGIRYLPNLYGISSSPLHGGIPTDRLLIAWNLRSESVVHALENQPYQPSTNTVSVPIPPATQDVPIAERLSGQAMLRDRLMSLLGEGYVITGFANDDDSARYILEKQ